jgi:hypothetical protein
MSAGQFCLCSVVRYLCECDHVSSAKGRKRNLRGQIVGVDDIAYHHAILCAPETVQLGLEMSGHG